jgi:hypothetical protein
MGSDDSLRAAPEFALNLDLTGRLFCTIFTAWTRTIHEVIRSGTNKKLFPLRDLRGSLYLAEPRALKIRHPTYQLVPARGPP